MQLTIPEATPVFLELFSPEKSVAKRDIPGGTGYAQVASQIARWQKVLSEQI